VELHVAGEPRPRIKTLRAGEGFASQASKWLNFGLGESSQIQRLVVRWPGGAPEEFLGLQVDRFYRIVQGSVAALEWTAPDSRQELQPARLEAEKLATPPRVVLCQRPPLPQMEYLTLEGRTANLDYRRNPLLLAIWAGACPVCVAELEALKAQHDKLKVAGLRVLALSIDRLDGLADLQATRSLCERLEPPFSVGWATSAVCGSLQLVHDEVFALHPPLPVPCSFLVDAEGRLAAIYRGKLDIAQVVSDLRLLPMEGDELRSRLSPFPGRWSQLPGHDATAAVARRLLSEGDSHAGADYLKRHQQQIRPPRKRAEVLLEAATRCFAKDDLTAAARWCRDAAAADPQYAKPQEMLGVSAELASDWEAALGAFRRALQLDPGEVQIKQRLARLLATCPDARFRDVPEAIKLAEKAVRDTKRRDANALETLASILAANNRLAEATQLMQEAIAQFQAAGSSELAELFSKRLLAYRTKKTTQ
jgi:tetratricopeptide (TPR) repeat protein